MGLAVQPFVAAFLGFVTFPAIDYTGRPLYGGRPVDSWDAATSVAAGAGLAGLFITLIGALPVLAFLLSRGPISRRQVFTTGVILGNAPVGLIAVLLIASRIGRGIPTDLSRLTYGPLGFVRALAFGALIGAGCAWVFWLIAGRHLGQVTTEAA